MRDAMGMAAEPIVVAGIAAALAVVHRHERIIAFELTWGEVDRARALVIATGLASRIRVHHIDAMRWMPEATRPVLRSA